MLQHRHDQPGHPNPGASEKWWHDVNLVHTKYPTAHDHIIATREFTPGTRKAKVPEYSYDEYGEPVISREPTPGEVEAKFLEEATKVALQEAEATLKPTKKVA